MVYRVPCAFLNGLFLALKINNTPPSRVVAFLSHFISYHILRVLCPPSHHPPHTHRPPGVLTSTNSSQPWDLCTGSFLCVPQIFPRRLLLCNPSHSSQVTSSDMPSPTSLANAALSSSPYFLLYQIVWHPSTSSLVLKLFCWYFYSLSLPPRT